MIRIYEALERLHRTALEFFQEAYFHMFQKHGDVRQDVAVFLEKGDVPKYVVLYLDHIFP